MSFFAQTIDYYNMLGYRNKQKASPMTEKLSNAEHWCRMIGKQVSLPFFPTSGLHGLHNFRQTNLKGFSRTNYSFQRPRLTPLTPFDQPIG